jgi:hypothetical protein
MSNTRVSIIILNWNGLDDTVDCLESLKKIDYPAYDIVVFDNGSTGNDATVLEEKFAGYIRLIRSKENLGYAAGINAGINYAKANLDSGYILLLNNDTIVDPLFLKLMVEAAEAEPGSGITGPKVYYYDYPDRIQSAGNTVDMYTGRISMIGNKQVDRGQYDNIKRVDFFAPCLLIKRRIIEDVGLLDDSYFLYWEDVDYCVRARRKGYKIAYVPASKIWHRTAVKLKLSDKSQQKSKAASIFPYYYITRNSWIFMRKHATKPQYAVFCLYFFTVNFLLMTGASLLYHRNLGLFRAFLSGIRDGLAGVSGKTFK